MESSLRIIVTGLMAQHPHMGGITWHYLQFMLGLDRLGHDVYYFEDSGEFPYNLDGGASGADWIARDCSYNVAHLAKVMARFGFENRWAYHFPLKSEWFGLPDSQRQTVLGSAELLINVSGTLEHPNRYRQIPHILYIDTDPVVTHIKLASGNNEFVERVDAHDSHFSFGESLHEEVPATGHTWRPTRQPIALSEWRPSTPRGESFTTVMNWTSYAPLVYAGRTYGQKDVEIKKFLELPSRVAPAKLKVALSRTQFLQWQSGDESLPAGATGSTEAGKTKVTARDLLEYMGWRIVDAIEACGNPDSYRNYIESSKAEWSVAKNSYVVGRPGWFSERSACYLAAGRPVIVQDTGFSRTLPVGEGILAFENLQEAAAAIKEVDANYARHARAARDIAEAYFDSDKVLTQLIDEALGDKNDRADEIFRQAALQEGISLRLGDQEQRAGIKYPTAMEVLKSNLDQHPAVKALAVLRPESKAPYQIEVLKRKKKGAVYRLAGAGQEQSTIMAKRCRYEKAIIERAVYEEVLPHLPVPALDYYGFVKEEDGQFCWLFLGDVGDRPYSPFVKEHRILAAKWLGAMHVATDGINIKTALRGRGPEYYLSHLRSAHKAIPEIKAISSLEATDRALLKEIVSMCEFLEGNWSQLEIFCDRMPRTFVHGDCLVKNVHVQKTQHGLTIAPFDWGGSGWGLPATDLGQLGLPYRGFPPSDPECETYFSIVHSHWPTLNIGVIQQLANLGQLFWSLKVISRGVPEFDNERTHMETLVNNFRVYASVLANSIRAASWVN